MRILFTPNDVGTTRVNLGIENSKVLHAVNKGEYDIGVYWNFKDVNTPGKRVDPSFVNYRCNNVTKKYVDEVFTDVFGYSSLVDKDFKGRCLSKRNKQSRGAVKIINYPEEADFNQGDKYGADYRIYQKLIKTKSNSFFHEHRVFIFDGAKFCLSKQKKSRFKSNADIYKFELMSESFTKYEVKLINTFCTNFGLDLGEIDVLRDEDDKIYIIDVNNIAGGSVFFKTLGGGSILEAYTTCLEKFFIERKT